MEKDELLLCQMVISENKQFGVSNVTPGSYLSFNSPLSDGFLYFPEVGQKNSQGQIRVALIKKFRWTANEAILPEGIETETPALNWRNPAQWMKTVCWADYNFGNALGINSGDGFVDDVGSSKRYKALMYDQYTWGNNNLLGLLGETSQAYFHQGFLLSTCRGKTEYCNEYVPHPYLCTHLATGFGFVAVHYEPTPMQCDWQSMYKLHVWYKYVWMDPIKYRQLFNRMVESKASQLRTRTPSPNAYSANIQVV